MVFKKCNWKNFKLRKKIKMENINKYMVNVTTFM